VNECDRGIHLHAGRQLPARDRPGHGQRALGGVDHRAQPQGLLDHRIQIEVILPSFKLLAQTSEHRLVSQQQLKRERKRSRGRLMPGAVVILRITRESWHTVRGHHHHNE
jgi:hypothetical protein